MKIPVENGHPRCAERQPVLACVFVVKPLLCWTYQVLNTFSDVMWHASWSITGDILAVSGGDNKVSDCNCKIVKPR